MSIRHNTKSNDSRIPELLTGLKRIDAQLRN